MSSNKSLHVWHRTILDILKNGPLDTFTIVQRLRDRGAYHSKATLRNFVQDLGRHNAIHKDPYRRAADGKGRMTVSIWSLTTKDTPVIDSLQLLPLPAEPKGDAPNV